DPLLDGSYGGTEFFSDLTKGLPGSVQLPGLCLPLPVTLLPAVIRAREAAGPVQGRRQLEPLAALPALAETLAEGDGRGELEDHRRHEVLRQDVQGVPARLPVPEQLDCDPAVELL